MNVFLRIITITWAEMMEYRLNFVLWRVRVVMQLLVMYFLWLAVYGGKVSIAGYTQGTMLAYIFLAYVLRTVTLSSTVFELGNIIHSGNLSNLLIKPMQPFGSIFARDIADKSINIMFMVGEIVLLYVLLRPPSFLSIDPMRFVAFLTLTMLGIVLYILASLMFCFVGFWASDVWAPRFLFFVVLEFFTGMLFPLDILPAPLAAIAQHLPFAYFVYTPTKVLLGSWGNAYIFQTIFIGAAWVVGLWFCVRWTWHKGLRVYTAVGK